jgi:hypothetical protein
MGGPFAEAAMALRDYGLAPVPLGGEDGRHPRVRGFNAWTEVPK